MADNELFKTTLMGGYDKDDVEKHVQKMRDEAHINQNRLLQNLKQKEKTIQELTAKLEEKDAQLKQKDQDIKEKYQSYIDNYEQIGRLVYESRVRADRMIIDARDEARSIIEQARTLARKRLDQVQNQIDDKLNEGRVKHKAIQKELDELLELLKEVRKRCMQSYESVETLVDSYTEQEDPFADIMSELEEKIGVPEGSLSENSSFQEQINYMRNQLARELPQEEEEFDEADDPEDLEKMSRLRHEIDDDDDEAALAEELPRIISVEDVLKSMDEQKAAKSSITGITSEETEPEEAADEVKEPAEEPASVSEEPADAETEFFRSPEESIDGETEPEEEPAEETAED